MADLTLKKLFVTVAAGTATPEGGWAEVSKSAAYADKLLFVVDEKKIYAKGIAYGMSPADKIGVDENDKILGISDNKLSSTLTVNIEKGTDDKEYIVLKGKNGAEVSKVDASMFVVAGMIDSIGWSETPGEESVLVVTWNTTDGKTQVKIDMSKFIDTYTSGDTNLINVSGYEITPVISAISQDATGLAKAADVWDAVEAAKADSHTHANKALLDTYAQTEANLADAVAKKHEHTNSTVLDKLTQDVIDNAHTHANQDELDKINAGDKQKWDDCVTTVGDENEGLVSEVATLNDQMLVISEVVGGYNDDRLTDERAAKWLVKDEDGHVESNGKSVLADVAITQEAITNWDPWVAYDGNN